MKSKEPYQPFYPFRTVWYVPDNRKDYITLDTVFFQNRSVSFSLERTEYVTVQKVASLLKVIPQQLKL